MTKAERIQAIICDTVDAHPSGANWPAIRDAVACKYQIKDWVREVRNPLQGLIRMNVIERTNSIFDEVYTYTAQTLAIKADMV